MLSSAKTQHTINVVPKPDLFLPPSSLSLTVIASITNTTCSKLSHRIKLEDEEGGSQDLHAAIMVMRHPETPKPLNSGRYLKLC